MKGKWPGGALMNPVGEGKVQMEVGISSGSTPGCMAGVAGRLFEEQGLLSS